MADFFLILEIALPLWCVAAAILIYKCGMFDWKERQMHMTELETAKELYRIIDKLDTFGRDIFKAAKVIRRNAATLNRIGEMECNGVLGPDGFAKWDKNDQARADRRRTTAEKRIVEAIKGAILSPFCQRLEIEFQGDPRGAPVLISLDGQERFACFY